MRFSLSPCLVLVVLGACSSPAASSAPADSGDEGVADDGSTAGCTSVGGTCEPIGTGSCPILQQNAQLCGNVILVCCLPPGGEIVVGPDAGEAGDSGVINPIPDAGGTTPTPDAGGTKPTPDAGGTKPTPDAGGTSPTPDAGHVTPPDDAGTPTDAGSD
jgi:hypothetical protein